MNITELLKRVDAALEQGDSDQMFDALNQVSEYHKLNDGLMKDALKQMLREMISDREIAIEIDSSSFYSAVNHVRGPTEWDSVTEPTVTILIDDQEVEVK